jgi:glycosyltransferase involved in cell wall biosynthesis
LKTTLLIPTLNEVEGMKLIMPRIKREWCDQILIVDGNSTDGTIEWARANGYEVYVQKQRGLRQAYNEVWPLIRGDIVITFSPDNNSIPELIPDLIAKMREGYDMVIVSRYLPPAQSQDDSWVTGFGNWMFTTLIRLLHGGRVTDAMVMYRAYRTTLPAELDLDKDESHATPERLFRTRISWEPLLTVRALKRKLRISEIAGDEPLRIGGKAKLQIIRWGCAYLFQVIREVFCWR